MDWICSDVLQLGLVVAMSDRSDMKGNKYAQKSDQPADTTMVLRLPTRKKNSYVKRAQSEGKKLSAWVLENLDKELER